MGTWGPGIALPAPFSQATKKLLTVGSNLHFITSFNSTPVCVPQVKCFTAILGAPLRADMLIMLHSDLPVRIKSVPIPQLGAKSNLTAMALRSELDLKISLGRRLSL